MVRDTIDTVLAILRKFLSLLLFISLLIAWPEYQGKMQTNLEASVVEEELGEFGNGTVVYSWLKQMYVKFHKVKMGQMPENWELVFSPWWSTVIV